MKKVDILEGEIHFLEREILKQFSTLDKEIIFNSNTNNYDIVVKEINKSLKGKSIVGGVSTTLLRDFFYKKKKKTVRTANIDKLYSFLYGLSRQSYFEQENIQFNSKKRLCFSVSPLTKEDRKLIEEKYKHEFEFLILQRSEAIILDLKRGANNIHLYINDLFLQDLDAMRLLLELFINHYVLMVSKFSISFEFDKTTKDKLFLRHNHLKYSDFWDNEEMKSYFIKMNEIVLYDKLIGREYLVILALLREISIAEHIDKKMSIEHFLPVLKEILNVKEEPLSNIYKLKMDDSSGSSKHGENYSFLCVLGYEGYYNQNERVEMLQYFSEFNNSLKDANITRIFTLECRRVKGVGWVSAIKPHDNELLYLYLLMNYQSNCRTLLLCYDSEKKDQIENQIFLEQDYVIRLDKKLLGETETNYLKNKVDRNIFFRENDAEIYFAFAEKSSGTNQLLRIQHANYIEQMFGDFANRMSLIDADDPNMKLIELNADDGSSLISVRTILGMTKFTAEHVSQLNLEVESYKEQING